MRRITLSVWIFALLIATLTSLPYVVGTLNTPDGWAYSGAPAVPAGAAVDYNSHLAKMWQGQRGDFAYHLLFTHEDHPGIPLLQGFYVALGVFGEIWSLPVIYHAARFLLTLGMVIAIWRFACRYFETPRERWLALLLATIVGGWSWLLILISPVQTAGISPIEFWLLDAFNLLGALTMPHFAASIILQIVAVLSFESWLDAGQPHSLAILTLALAAESLLQPYVILFFGPLIALWSGYQVFVLHKVTLQRALWLILPLAVHALLVIYQYLAINSDPIWSDFAAQNITQSPPPIYLLLGYLPLLLPTLLGLGSLWQGEPHWRLLLLWVGLVAILAYLPLPTQRRYLLGMQTTLAMLAAYGWIRVIWPRILAGYRPLLTGVYVTLASVSTLAMLGASMAAVRDPSGSTVYDTPDEVMGFAWLRRETSPQDLVLTTFDRRGQGSGGRIVAATGQRVYAGHWIETAFLDEKVRLLHRFFDPEADDNWRRRYLLGMDAAYLWYDESARALGNWDPGAASYLEAVFRSGNLTIYRVSIPQ